MPNFAYIANNQVQERKNRMNFFGQEGAGSLIIIQQFCVLIVRSANVHDVDVVVRRGVHGDELTIDCLTTAAVVLQTFQRRDDNSCAVKVLP